MDCEGSWGVAWPVMDLEDGQLVLVASCSGCGDHLVFPGRMLAQNVKAADAADRVDAGRVGLERALAARLARRKGA